MIQIKNVSVFYKSKKQCNKALASISFDADDNDICAIIGPSGCGKSTLLNVLAGIINEYEGEVFLDDERLNPHYHSIGLIPQNFGLLPWKTVKENLLIPFKIKRSKINESILKRMDEITERLNIYHLYNRYPKELSGGQKQRVSIARAFLMKPDLLLMDEAFSALDAIIREEAQELFLDIWKDNKSTTFFVTHNIDEAIYMGKKIVIMSNTPGEIVKVIDNELFSNKDFRNLGSYSALFAQIKDTIRKGINI